MSTSDAQGRLLVASVTGAAWALALALTVACADPRSCGRNSDCPQGDVCHFGACTLDPGSTADDDAEGGTDGGVTVTDGGVTVTDGGMTVGTGTDGGGAVTGASPADSGSDSPMDTGLAGD